MSTINTNTIDLDRAEHAVSSLLSTVHHQQHPYQRYQPKTINEHNKGRYVFLPMFPTKSFGPKNHLLLANVPLTSLTSEEIARRQYGADTNDALMLMNNYQYSDLDGFSLSEKDANELSARLQVGKSIITFNATQLRSISYTFLAYREVFQRNILEEPYVTVKEPTLNSKQMSLALEFFLQMDVDIFYMKTCSFRQVELFRDTTNDGDDYDNSNREEEEGGGLFCHYNEPQERYKVVPCTYLLCSCCHPRIGWRRNQPWPIIDFESSSKHQFVNGYTTYLNCSVTCATSNIIYTMKCPCGQYDYVDSTESTLSDATIWHREHGNRIIHEMLTGSPLYRGLILDPNEKQKEVANKMRLYQHSARCPLALRTFLARNPDYWCFIPMLWIDAVAANRVHFQNEVDRINLEEQHIIALTSLDNQRVYRYMEHVPVPPSTHGFSTRQRQKQRQFFEQFVSFPLFQLPYSPVDLYQLAILAVLPTDCSTILRYIIETLFIVHGETKLNMICPLGSDPQKRYGPPFNSIWCDNLNPSS